MAEKKVDKRVVRKDSMMVAEMAGMKVGMLVAMTVQMTE